MLGPDGKSAQWDKIYGRASENVPAHSKVRDYTRMTPLIKTFQHGKYTNVSYTPPISHDTVDVGGNGSVLHVGRRYVCRTISLKKGGKANAWSGSSSMSPRCANHTLIHLLDST